MGVPIDFAVRSALASWIQNNIQGLVGVPEGQRVIPEWPPEFRWPTISIINGGDVQTETIDPRLDKDGYEPVHMGAQTMFVGDPIDLATCLTVLEGLRAAVDAHGLDVEAHVAVDTDLVVTAPAATDLPTGAALLANVVEALNPHLGRDALHQIPDLGTPDAAIGAITTTEQLVSATKAVVGVFNKHIVMGRWWWHVGYTTVPIQVDVWGDTPAYVDHMVAILEGPFDGPRGHFPRYPLLHAPRSATIGLADSNPVGDGIALQMGDGHRGILVCDFDRFRSAPDEDSTAGRALRAMVSGEATVPTFKTAYSPRLTSIEAQISVAGEASPEDANTSSETIER